MIKVKIKKDEITIKGHAEFDDYGKDIVCASASSIVITSINACLRYNKDSISYKEEQDKLTIKLKSDNEFILLIIDNMIASLKELSDAYPKNIKIEEEERP